MKHKNFKSRPELLRAVADSIEMQEKAGVEPVAKCPSGGVMAIEAMRFMSTPNEYELPLAVVEGRRVWADESELYDEDGRKHRFIGCDAKLGLLVDCNGFGYTFDYLSWNTPAPKTVVVELSVEDVRDLSTWHNCTGKVHNNLGAACRKALEEMKK